MALLQNWPLPASKTNKANKSWQAGWSKNLLLHSPKTHRPLNQPLAFITDIHGDAESLVRSLIAGGLLKPISSITHLFWTEQGQKRRLVLGGDCFDKGPSTLVLLRLLKRIWQDKPDSIWLVGNHDLRFMLGMRALTQDYHPLHSHFFSRMGKKAIALLAEMHTECPADFPVNHPAYWVDAYWPQAFREQAKAHLGKRLAKKEIKQLHAKQADMQQACVKRFASERTFNQACSWAVAQFLLPEGEFADLIDRWQLHYVAGPYWFCHAGVNDAAIAIWQQGREQGRNLLETQYQQAWQTGDLFHLYYGPLGALMRTKYRKYDWPFTAQGAQQLKAAGIIGLVNGHRDSVQGQQLYVRQGLWNFDCDTQMNRHCRSRDGLSHNGWGITLFETHGRVTALSSDHAGARCFEPQG